MNDGRFKVGNNINLGKKYPPERCKKQGTGWRGKKRPEMSGENNPNWVGGKEKRKRPNPESQKNYLRKLRESTLQALGGQCIRCGFSDTRALQIDHVNGGGSKERKDRNYVGNFHKHVLQSFLSRENKYQLLCANCNWIKRFENKETNRQGGV